MPSSRLLSEWRDRDEMEHFSMLKIGAGGLLITTRFLSSLFMIIVRWDDSTLWYGFWKADALSEAFDMRDDILSLANS